MAKLIFMFDGNVLGEYELDKERMTIGRRPSNDIHIDNLAVSGEHAVVVTLSGDSFLEDLNSTNGTFVNKKRIKKHVLQNQDVIELGKYQLKFVGTSVVQKTPSEGFAHTIMTRPVVLPKEEPAVDKIMNIEPLDAATIDPKPARPKPIETEVVVDTKVDTGGDVQAYDTVVVSPASSEPPDAKIKVMSGADSGVDVLLNKTMVKLGRYGDQLAVITRRPNGYFITHVDGKTRPTVNGQEIGVHAHLLNSGDMIVISGDRMQFLYD